MDPTTLKEKLITVLSHIQAASDLACPSLTGATKPIDDIPGFDSKVWPVATTILSTEIGAPIPNEVNIFVDDQAQPRSIAQMVGLLCALLDQQPQSKADAA